MKPILLIGYGNQTRSDDGVGWYIAEKIKNILENSDLEVLKLNQLTIELAEDIKDRELVIFVDAHVKDDKELIRSEKLKPNYKLGLTAHFLTPETLLAICEGLYKKVPNAYLFSIMGFNFDFGESLSAQTKKAADEAVENIIEMFKKIS